MNEAELMAQRLGAARLMARRFRGFLPVVIDVETGGFHATTDALLEIAAVIIEMDPDGTLRRGPTHSYHVKPFEGGRLDPAALSITGIDPHHPLRPALPEPAAASLAVATAPRTAGRSPCFVCCNALRPDITSLPCLPLADAIKAVACNCLKDTIRLPDIASANGRI